MPRTAAPLPSIVLALPRGEAARACGISPVFFDRLVEAGVIPSGRVLSDGRTAGKTLWLVEDLRAVLSELPSDDGTPLDHGRQARPL